MNLKTTGHEEAEVTETADFLVSSVDEGPCWPIQNRNKGRK